MLTIRSAIVEAVRSAREASDLYEALQGAIELEHATIPVYLQALYSIRRGTNEVIAGLIRSVVVEEMLHMTIAANVLNAIGGAPRINTPAFIPTYPGPLPMNVHGSLQVGLAPLSKSLIKDVFMAIEAPEHPTQFPVAAQGLASTGYATIGLFYAAVVDKLRELGDGIFTGDRARQVVDGTWFPGDELFPIHDVASATHGIHIIVEQGEGTTGNPLEPDGEPAHYYRFAEIFHGRHLVPDPGAPEKFSYSGAPIPFDQAGVWDMLSDPKVSGYAPGSTARAYAERFNGIYTNLLNCLQATFDGDVGRLSRAIGIMYELRLAADALIEIRDAATGRQAAPTFEYAPGSA
ncbi:MAG: ferritin-like protein [Methylobacterium radiotolerans]